MNIENPQKQFSPDEEGNSIKKEEEPQLPFKEKEPQLPFEKDDKKEPQLDNKEKEKPAAKKELEEKLTKQMDIRDEIVKLEEKRDELEEKLDDPNLSEKEKKELENQLEDIDKRIKKFQKILEVLEKETTDKFSSKEIVDHFIEELQKIKDLPKNTEIQKRNVFKQAKKLLEHWLPFGCLDDFQGLDELLETMEEAKPKTMISFNYQKEKIASKVAVHMALEWEKWKNDPQEKIEITKEFINKWLKDKSFYYQAAEKLKQFKGGETKKSEGKTKEKPSKLFRLDIETSNLLKLVGDRDKTISKVAKILAMQNVSYNQMEGLVLDIENQNIQKNTINELLGIEEMDKEEKEELFKKTKEKIEVFPTLPLKKKYYEKVYGEKLEEAKEPLAEKEKIALEDAEKNGNLLLKILEKLTTDPESQEYIEALKKKISEIVDKNKKETPKIVKQTKEFIKKAESKDTKKLPFWSTLGTFFGYSVLLLFIGILLLEIEAGKNVSGAGAAVKIKKG